MTVANISVPIRTSHLVNMTSHNTFHSGHLPITVILRGPDGDRYGQVLLYILVCFVIHGDELVNKKNEPGSYLFTRSCIKENTCNLYKSEIFQNVVSFE